MQRQCWLALRNYEFARKPHNFGTFICVRLSGSCFLCKTQRTEGFSITRSKQLPGVSRSFNEAANLKQFCRRNEPTELFFFELATLRRLTTINTQSHEDVSGPARRVVSAGWGGDVTRSPAGVESQRAQASRAQCLAVCSLIINLGCKTAQWERWFLVKTTLILTRARSTHKCGFWLNVARSARATAAARSWFKTHHCTSV